MMRRAQTLPCVQILLTAAVVLVALGSQGCRDLDQGAESPVDLTDTTDAASGADLSFGDTGSTADGETTTPDTTTASDTTVDPRPDAELPVDPTALSICQPRARSLAEPLDIDLFAVVTEGVAAIEAGQAPRLVAVEAEVTRDPFGGKLELAPGEWPEPGTVTCDADGQCFETLPALARVWRQATPRPWYPGQDTGEDWAGIILPKRHVDTDALHVTLRAARPSYSIVVTVERTFDRQGHLLVEDYHWGDDLWWHTEQTWHDDRLVSAHHEDHVNGTGGSAVVWDYDEAGRLTRVAVRDQSGHVEGRWRYDAAGRPQRLERLKDGARVLQHEWTWGESEEGLPVIAEHRTERFDTGYVQTRADTWQADQMVGMFPEHLAPRQAVDPATGAACQMPPLTAGHGYPAWEQVYDLGWPVGERPDDIEFAYGPMRYYVSMRDAPYTHSGPELYGWGWEAYAMGAPHVSVVTRYDAAGRMVEEEAEAFFDDGTTRVSRRQRTLGVHGVERDTMTGMNGHSSTLTFERDAEGRMVRREHHIDEVLVAAQDWIFDAAGHIAEHETAYSSVVINHYYPWQDDEAFEAMLDQIDGLDQGTRILMDRSADGRVRERLDPETGEVTERITWDDAGRIVEVLHLPAQWQHIQAWDEATGARILSLSDWQIDGEIDDRYEVELGSAGQLLSRAWGHPSLELVETFIYE